MFTPTRANNDANGSELRILDKSNSDPIVGALVGLGDGLEEDEAVGIVVVAGCPGAHPSEKY